MLHPGKQTQAISLSGRLLYQLNHFTAHSLAFLKMHKSITLSTKFSRILMSMSQKDTLYMLSFVESIRCVFINSISCLINFEFPINDSRLTDCPPDLCSEISPQHSQYPCETPSRGFCPDTPGFQNRRPNGPEGERSSPRPVTSLLPRASGPEDPDGTFHILPPAGHPTCVSRGC